MVSNSDFTGFLFPVFAVRAKTGRVCNFTDWEEVINYRNSLPEDDRDRFSIEIFEYGF